MSPVRVPRSAGSVMVVDDNPANLKLMGDMLGQQGYEARLFPRGRLALASAAQRPPDLVLLDINMPEMDGYEVCRRFKADHRLSGIPVIFLSALQDTQDKIKGLQCGGVDYISKPFQLEEVQARVETHLKIHALQRELQFHNVRLEETVAARTRELAEANDRLKILDRAKNEFLSLISHELRTPLNGLLGVGTLVLDGLPHTEENHELIEMFEVSSRRIQGIIEDALLLTQIDVAGAEFRPAPVAFRSVLEKAVDMCSAFARERGVTLEVTPATASWEIAGEEKLLVTALHALVEAGVKFTTSGRTLRVRHEAGDGMIQVFVESEGKAIREPLLDSFFDVFSTNEAKISGVDLGLRPAVAFRIFTLFGGTVSVSNRDVPGIRLVASIRTTARSGAVPLLCHQLAG